MPLVPSPGPWICCLALSTRALGSRPPPVPPFSSQDFEAITPNLLARSIETVEGGGLVVLLLSNLNSLTQLFNMTMDSHARFRTESHQVGAE